MRKGEVDGRIDPNFYQPIYRISKREHFRTLNEVSKYILHPPEYPRVFTESGLQLIRSQNVRPLGMSLGENPVYFSEELLKNKKIVFAQKGDVLIVRSGVNAGDVAVVEQDIKTAIIGADTLLVKCSDEVIPKFLQVYFHTDSGKLQILKHTTGATNKHLNAENLKKVLIPDVNKVVQTKAIAVFEQSLEAKRAKEAEAKELLAGIDAYLLDKLGINPPTKTTAKKTFFTKFSEVSGSRFDPIYYASELFSFLRATQYELKTIKEISWSIKSGFGAGKQDQEREENGLIQIRPTNIGNEGNLKLEKNVYLPLDLLETQKENLLQTGDVLFNNTNSQELVGKTVYFNEEGDFLFSNHITRIRVKEDNVSPYFLALLLNLFQHRKIFYSICTNWNNQSGVGNELLGSLKIPLPPLEIQKEIAAHIQSIREQAKRLEMEAKAEIEQAKAEVERMILGE